MARLAADAHLGPGRGIALRRDVEPLREIGGVAVEAVGVPDLPKLVRPVRDRRDLLPVHPAPALDVPEGRQHVDAAIRERREIALVALRAERVADREGLGLPASVRDRQCRTAAGAAELIAASVVGEVAIAGEVRRRPSLRRSAWSCGCAGSAATDRRSPDGIARMRSSRGIRSSGQRLMEVVAASVLVSAWLRGGVRNARVHPATSHAIGHRREQQARRDEDEYAPNLHDG